MFTNCPFCPEENNQKSVMTTNHLTAGTEATPKVSGILDLLQTKGKIQQMSRICQILLQTFRELLIILLQILNIMRTPSHYMDTDYIEDGKQINDDYKFDTYIRQTQLISQ
jgi:alkyl hydroperoxide reductase subunit AhpF